MNMLELLIVTIIKLSGGFYFVIAVIAAYLLEDFSYIYRISIAVQGFIVGAFLYCMGLIVLLLNSIYLNTEEKKPSK